MTRGDRDKTCGLKELQEFLDTLNHVEFNKFERLSSLILNLLLDFDIFKPDQALCEIFQPNPVLRDHYDYEISEQEFRGSVRKTLLKIQEYL